MARREDPPTFAEPVVVDDVSGRSRFNPIWLKWFIDFAAEISAIGSAVNGVLHNALTDLQGGTSGERYHLTQAQAAVVAALPTFANGTYTPTITNQTNVSATTAYQCQYLRVGSTVTVSGAVMVDPTATGIVEVGISLPVASDLGAGEHCAGTAACHEVAGQSGVIRGDFANNRAQLRWRAVDTTQQDMYFTFTYTII